MCKLTSSNSETLLLICRLSVTLFLYLCLHLFAKFGVRCYPVLSPDGSVYLESLCTKVHYYLIFQ